MDLFNRYDIRQYRKYLPKVDAPFLIDNLYEIIPGCTQDSHPSVSDNSLRLHGKLSSHGKFVCVGNELNEKKKNNINWEYTSCAVQYIDQHTCRVVFRIMVDFQELKPNDQYVVKIYEKDNLDIYTAQDITLDESCFDYKTDLESILPCRQETIINTPFQLYVKDPREIDIKIPKTIVQTALKSTMHFHMLSSCLSHVDLNPSFQYVFMDEGDVLDFIEKNYSKEVLYIYKLIIPGAFRADFFRYLYLYKYGGFYFDCKSISKVSLYDLVDKSDEFIFCKDRNYRAIYNAVLFSVPGYYVLQRVISEIINRVNLLHINKNCQSKINELLCRYGIYGITGPVLLYEIIYNHRESKELSPKLIFSNHTNQIHCRKYQHKIYIINPVYWNKETHFEKICVVPFYPSYYKNYKSVYNNSMYYRDQYSAKKLVN